MLWGAPLCFLLQARPVKIWSKQLFFMCSFPPGIVLSLLPAPQQAILNMDVSKAYGALYAPQEEQDTDKEQQVAGLMAATKKRAEALQVEKDNQVLQGVVEDVEEDEEEVEDEEESEQEESDEDEDEDESDLED
jgi:hypothetical protein